MQSNVELLMRSAHSTAVSSRVVRVTVGLERELVFAGNGVRSVESSANASVRVRMAVVCEVLYNNSPGR